MNQEPYDVKMSIACCIIKGSRTSREVEKVRGKDEGEGRKKRGPAAFNGARTVRAQPSRLGFRQLSMVERRARCRHGLSCTRGGILDSKGVVESRYTP